MKLCVIGTGYVGLVSGACFADVGNQVVCVDKNEQKITELISGRIPIYEPGLGEIISRNKKEGRLAFTTDIACGLKDAEICFITVDTPPDGDGRADLTNVIAVARKVGELLDHPAMIVTKSTVPVGTTMEVKKTVAEGLLRRGLDPKKLLSVASNPEFLKEGDAVSDFMKPDRVVAGVEDEETGKALHALYSPFMRRQDRFIQMSVSSAELAKYAANSMLATRISFMNELARLCDKVGADITDIKRSIGSDPRIGPDFLYAGLGYGGACFPKDTKAVIELGKENGARLHVVEAAETTNAEQREWFWQKICAHFGGESALAKKNFGIWGLAFKANTDDVRFAPSLYIVEKLIACGASVSAFDPEAADTAKKSLAATAEKIKWAAGAYPAVEGADALIICTEWREFRSPDFKRMLSIMKTPTVFDGRNLYDPFAMRAMNFKYISVGRPA